MTITTPDYNPITVTSEITVELVRSMAADRFVAEAARVSTAGERAEEPRPFVGLIKALMREKHGSPFEHNSFTFRIRVPRFVEVEHVRHRAGWSYNIESGRYRTHEPVFYAPADARPLTQVGKPMDYELEPGSMFQKIETVSTIRRLAQEAYDEYQYLLNIGVAREVARQVLPQNLMVTAYTTCNARSLMAFLSLRTSDAGTSKPLHEIELVAKGYEEALAVAMPITHSAFEEFGRVAP